MTQRPKQPPVKHAEKMRRKSIEQKHLQAAKGGRIDGPFLLLVLLLTIIGLVMLFSASFPSAYYETGTPTYYFKRQAIYAAVGLAGLALAARFNYQRWRGASRLLLILSLFLLMLVIIPVSASNTTTPAAGWASTVSLPSSPRRSPSWRSSSTSPTASPKSGRKCCNGGRALCPMP